MELLPAFVGTPELNRVYHVDALTLLGAMPDASVDLIVTSPPYNLRNTTGGILRKKSGKWDMGSLANGYTTHDDNMPHDEYVNWQRQCLTEMMRVIPSNGAIFYNHKWRVQDGLLQDRSGIVSGFPVRQIIIWQRAGGINFNDNYFLPTYEVVYLICKPDFKLAPKASGRGDVWRIPQETNNSHPAPFPIEFAKRCISSTNARIICDPFMGSGTVAVAAKELQRDYIGSDLSGEYVEIARKRLAQPYTLPMFEGVS